MTRSKNHHYWKNFILLGLTIIIISGCIFVVFWAFFTSNCHNRLEQIGSFGGVFLVALTLLFQIRSFRAQQVEGKFFEMVKYYRDNIAELTYVDPSSKDKEIKTGRIVPKLIFDQYVIARKIANNFFQNKTIEPTLVKSLPKKEKKLLKESNADEIFNKSNIAYQITYWGVAKTAQDDLDNHLTNLNDLHRKDLIDVFKLFPVHYSKHYNGESPKDEEIKPVQEIIEKLKDNEYTPKKTWDELKTEIQGKKYVKFFGGHQYHLGHFFRHLYQTVNYIDDQPWWLLSKSKKKEYVKMLRAQMSNYEQALLFINSLSGLGLDWEYNNKEGKKLITKYELIKNLPEHFIPDMNPKDFYPGITFEFEE